MAEDMPNLHMRIFCKDFFALLGIMTSEGN